MEVEYSPKQKFLSEKDWLERKDSFPKESFFCINFKLLVGM